MANTTRAASASAINTPGAGAAVATRRRRYSLLTRHDKLLLALMVGIPLTLDVILIWGPTLASILLSFTNWDGVGDITSKNFVGLKNYQFMFTGYTLFWPAFTHNLIWLLWLTLIATPLGMLFAVLLDREIRGAQRRCRHVPIVGKAATGARYFLVLNAALLLGFVRFASGLARPTWDTTPRRA